MKNILFVGPYYQSDGWGNAARQYIRSIKLTENNLATRPIYLNSQTEFDKLEEFEQFEKNSFDSYDVIIQNSLPTLFRKYGFCKNIGLSFFETTIRRTPWVLPINLMDEVWVSSEFEKSLLSSSGVNRNIEVVNIPVDTSRFDWIHFLPSFNDLMLQIESTFKFYFIGEFVERKNLEDLIKAFLLTFNSSENVSLVIKTNMVGVDASKTRYIVEGAVNEIKRLLGINESPPILVITDYLHDKEIDSLHRECDCFVMPSYGEAYCIPAVEAVGFGSKVIFSDKTGIASVLKNVRGTYPVKSTKTPAIVNNRPLPYLYNGKDYWHKIDLMNLMDTMRKAYNSPVRVDSDYINRMSLESIAKKIEEVL